MRIFLTGGTGFIGSHVLKQGIERGYEFVSLRRPNGRGPRIPLINHPVWLEKKLEEVEESDINGCDVVLHLASHTPNPPYDTLVNCMLWNVIEPLRLFQKARSVSISRYVVAASCFEYGRAGERYDFIPANAPLEPTQTYPASKACASIAFQQWAIEHDLSLILARIFQVYGEGEEPARLWPSIRSKALAGLNLEMTPAEQVRDFISVESVACRLLDSCLELCESSISLRISRNIGSGTPVTVRQFAEKWWMHWGSKGELQFGSFPYRNGEVMRFVPDLKDVHF